MKPCIMYMIWKDVCVILRRCSCDVGSTLLEGLACQLGCARENTCVYGH